jgi:amino acid permease
MICQFYVSVSPISDPPGAATFFENYLGVPIFIIMWAGYKLIKRSKVVPLVSAFRPLIVLSIYTNNE